MRWAVSIVLLAAPAGFPVARAAVVSQYVQGSVSGAPTTDTYGLFGPVGADLAGLRLSLFLQYDGSKRRFPDQYICALGDCLAYDTGTRSHNIPGSVLIVLKLNGVRKVYVPDVAARVEFINVYSNHSISFQTDYSLPAEAVGVELNYASTVIFGAPLSPVNPPVNTGYPNIIYLNTRQGTEQVSFAIDKASQ